MPSSEESETKRSKYVHQQTVEYSEELVSRLEALETMVKESLTETSPLRLKERLCAISGAAVLAIVSVGNLQLRQTQAEATAREHFK